MVRFRNGFLFLLALYGVEFLDELIYGLHGAVVPEIKSDLALTYTQIGLLSTIPGLIALAGEPLIGLLGDTRHRRALVGGGIVATTLGLFLTSLAGNFLPLLFAFSILFVASGAYVNLAQATLIDRDAQRTEHTMARWTLIGAVGVAIAPLIVTALFEFGFGWREFYFAASVIAALFIPLLFRQRFDAHTGADAETVSPRQLLLNLIAALKNRELLRWVLLTELADLMLDKLLEVTGLYFHDVVGVSLAAASGAVAVYSLAGLAGNTLLVPALERIRGIRVLRASALIVLLCYFLFLGVSNVWLKYALIGVIAFCNSAWFPILRAKTFEVLPGQSGLVIAITSLGNLSILFVPTVVGSIADAFGLHWAMWVLALGPIALLIGLPSSLSER
ncbi:MAG: MFS transporter [Chloroflexi bacterium]|nr:MFS transporter [Chloroflexota bacterium]